MIVGSFGEVTFQVSSSVMETFRNLKISESASYAQHKVHGQAAVPEFTGFECPQVSFEMTLSAFLGVDPKQEYDKLRRMMRSKKGYALALGTELYGELWAVSSLSRAFEYLYRDGTPISFKVNVSLIGGEG